MASAARMNTAWQTSAAEVRSMALADRHGFTRGHVRYGWGAPEHCEQFRVYSETTHRHDYLVTYSIRADRVVSCTCYAGQYGASCKHKGAARKWVEARKEHVAFVEEMAQAGQAHYEPSELLTA